MSPGLPSDATKSSMIDAAGVPSAGSTVGRGDPVHPDHLAAQGVGDLRDGAAHPAADAEHRDGLSLAQVGGLDHPEPSGDEVDPYGRGLLEAQVLGLVGQGRRRDGEHLRVRAVVAEPDISSGSPDLGAGPVTRPANDDPGEVASGSTGQGRLRELAGDVLQVRRVHRGGLDGYHGLAVPRDGVGHLGEVQDAGIAEVVETQSVHDGTFLSRGASRPFTEMSTGI
jgi:hypothetical protein